MKLVLKHPVTVAGVTVTELNFRERITAGDVRGVNLARISDVNADDIRAIAGRLAGQNDAVMQAVDFEDFYGIAEVVLGFLGRGRPGLPTGSTASP